MNTVIRRRVIWCEHVTSPQCDTVRLVVVTSTRRPRLRVTGGSKRLLYEKGARAIYGVMDMDGQVCTVYTYVIQSSGVRRTGQKRRRRVDGDGFSGLFACSTPETPLGGVGRLPGSDLKTIRVYRRRLVNPACRKRLGLSGGGVRKH